MRKSDLQYAVALVPMDFLAVVLASFSAYNLRFGWVAEVRPVIFRLPVREFAVLACVFAAVVVLCLAIGGLYRTGTRRLGSELGRSFLAVSTAMLGLVLAVFFQREQFSSRFIVLAAWAFAVAYVLAGRIAMRLVRRAVRRYGRDIRQVIVIGRDTNAVEAIRNGFANEPELGLAVRAAFDTFDEARETLDREIKSGAIDEIVVADVDLSRNELGRILAFCQSRQLGFRYSADLLAAQSSNIELGALAGIPFVTVTGTSLAGWSRVFKRIFDIIGSFVLIVVTSPIMLAAAIAVKIDSVGPVFFHLDDGTLSRRVGENARLFPFLKFRSMYSGTHGQRYRELADQNTRAGGPLVKIANDPRVTRVGRFIRRYSIDELPQLFSVLIGDMSLVGPRPHLPEEVAKYADHERRVLAVKPGLTGLGQVSGRANLSFAEEVRLDTYYIENWSLGLDIMILLKTPFVVLARKGAY